MVSLALTPNVINAFHVALVGPLLIYLARNQGASNALVLQSLPYLALGGIAYHLFRIVTALQRGSGFGYLQLINLFHIAFVFPLLYWIGLQGGNIGNSAALFVGGLGLVALLYHAFRLWRRLA